MTGYEIKHTFILAWIFACRMLGLFMIYPVLALYAGSISGATPALIGLAMGIYGLSQALFQLPFGWLSDRWGRKPVILAGLGLFAIGSLVAAFSDSIEGLILGRSIQGMGAIGAAILAWVADSTRESVRTRAMALIGVTIGFAFALSLVLGPLVSVKGGLSGLFLLTALLTGLGALLIIFFTDSAPHKQKLVDFPEYSNVFSNKTLWRLYCNIFVLHALLSASFLILPIKIQDITGLNDNVWKFYFPVLGLSLLLVAPMLRHAEELKRQHRMMQHGMLGLALTVLGFLFSQHIAVLAFSVCGFFVAFNFLEASLPAMVSRVAPSQSRGAALGLYSCAQFLGLFTGGALGGMMQSTLGINGIAAGLTGLALIGWGALQSSSFFQGKLQTR